jgi:hypothetical protein
VVIEVHSLTGFYDILLIASELTLNNMEEKSFHQAQAMAHFRNRKAS